ncbi:MAG: DUF4382 domain-containing protein [Gammaproteobacteria bacterium]|jgi:hypothetical protein
MNIFRSLPFAAGLAAVLLVAGCNGSGSSSANLTLKVADTPIDSATSVTVTFTGVQLMGPNGQQEFDFTTPKQIDLIATQGGNAATLLDGVSIDAGNYQWIRLMVDMSQSSITLDDGSTHPLTIPSGDQTGLKLVSGFMVALGDQADFTIDFDLRKAVTDPQNGNGDYYLRPALRLINNQQVGSIAGTVANTLSVGGTAITDPACGPAVYVYDGADVTPVDINDSSTVQPLTTATLSLNNDTGDYDYSVDYAAPGDYTLAVTCAMNDDPAAVDSGLAFATPRNATVTADQTTTVDFP